MEKVQGIGGIFFKTKDPKAIREWYAKHLGVAAKPDSPWGAGDDSPLIEWRDKDDSDRTCYTVFDMFPDDTDFFGDGGQAYMLNFRVNDLDTMLADLKTAGIEPIGEIMQIQAGRLVRLRDPEGRIIELWEPKAGF